METSSVVRLGLFSLAMSALLLVGCSGGDTVTEQETPASVTSATSVEKKGAGQEGGSAAAGMMAAPPGVKTGTP
jgi:PBP1b-binding outer membrane lipoprotein LpoB